MLIAMIHLRQADVASVAPTDEVEDIDIEEMGFQATYTRLAAAALPSVQVVPFSSVDEVVRNFVVQFSAVDAMNGGALTARIREMSPEVKSILSGWGIPL
jgi:hypothetical protein